MKRLICLLLILLLTDTYGTLVKFPRTIVPGMVTLTMGHTALTIDASGEKVGFIIPAPKTGTIEKIIFLTGNVTTGDTLKVSVQGVDLSNGDPDGTIHASGTVVVADGDDNAWKVVNVSSAVTLGQPIAIVIEYNSYVAGNIVINSNLSLSQNNAYSDIFVASWTKQARSPCVCLMYSDGGVETFNENVPALFTAVAPASNTTPDEIGNLIYFPFQCRVVGAVLNGRQSADFSFVLYDFSDNILAQTTLDGDNKQSTGDSPSFGYFTPVTLSSGTFYRITVKPTTTTAIRVYSIATSTITGHMEQLSGGTSVYYTTRADAGAWTNTATTRASVSLIVDQVHDVQGAGGEAPAGGTTVILESNWIKFE